MVRAGQAGCPGRGSEDGALAHQGSALPPLQAEEGSLPAHPLQWPSPGHHSPATAQASRSSRSQALAQQVPLPALPREDHGLWLPRVRPSKPHPGPWPVPAGGLGHAGAPLASGSWAPTLGGAGVSGRPRGSTWKGQTGHSGGPRFEGTSHRSGEGEGRREEVQWEGRAGSPGCSYPGLELGEGRAQSQGREG